MADIDQLVEQVRECAEIKETAKAEYLRLRDQTWDAQKVYTSAVDEYSEARRKLLDALEPGNEGE